MQVLSLGANYFLPYQPTQARDFTPDTGMLDVCRHSVGPGIRIDGYAYPGMVISPHFDSLLVKYTASHKTWDGAIRRMRRALRENHIRGVKTNIPFLLNGECIMCSTRALHLLSH